MVSEEVQHSDVIDPLAAYGGINLFPCAFGIFPDSSKPHDLVTDIDGIHKHLKSVVSRSSSKLIEQARSILDGNSNLKQYEPATFLVNNENKEEVTANGEESPQKRRPALNRKRARFSLKPNARQPSVNLEPTFDIKQLKDPEEFFLAYERLENAKREIQKQTGAVLKDSNQQNPSTNTRQRRPGILGRSVRYKHQYSSLPSENDENVEPSQVAFDYDNISSSMLSTGKGPSPPLIVSEKKIDEDVSSEEGEKFVASTTKVENKVNKILDELLSVDCEDLEGDRAINILQEYLQIKPINLEKLCLPDLETTQTVNLKSSSAKLPKHSLLSVNNQLQRLKTLTSKEDDENLVIATSSSLRSPLASLPALSRKIPLSESSGDPFSTHDDIDQSPARNHSLLELSNHLFDAHGMAEQLSDPNLKSLLTEYGSAIANGIKPPKILIGDFDSTCKISSSNVLNVSQVDSVADLSGTRTSMEAKDISGSSIEVEANEKLGCLESQADAVDNATNALDIEMKDQEGSTSEQPSTSKVDVIKECSVGIQSQLDQSTATCPENIVNGPCRNSEADHHDEMEDHKGSASEQPSTSKVDAIKECPVGIQSQLDQSTATCPENIVDGPLRSNEADHQDKAKPKSCVRKQRKGKTVTGRQSLAGAGTTWQCGVRRSTRFKTRPLEYWKGERLLFGRVHESLVTVIGLKYVSPAKGNGQPTLKVKSLVSDDYKNLVELAALH